MFLCVVLAGSGFPPEELQTSGLHEDQASSCQWSLSHWADGVGHWASARGAQTGGGQSWCLLTWAYSHCVARLHINMNHLTPPDLRCRCGVPRSTCTPTSTASATWTRSTCAGSWWSSWCRPSSGSRPCTRSTSGRRERGSLARTRSARGSSWAPRCRCATGRPTKRTRRWQSPLTKTDDRGVDS